MYNVLNLSYNLLHILVYKPCIYPRQSEFLQEVHEAVVVLGRLSIAEVGGVEQHVRLATWHNDGLEGGLVLQQLVQRVALRVADLYNSI